MDKKKQKRRVRLWLYFSGVVFFTILLLSAFLITLWIVFYLLGVAKLNPFEYHLRILSLLLFSLFLGGGVSFTVGRLLITPIRNLGDAFEELSKGNFDVKMPTDGKLHDIREIAKRFNEMTYELAHVETLRTDFVDNVSHEFKTPISTIEGYATLLQNPELSQEKREYYIEKILGSTRQLSTLSSNILTLSKLENQEAVINKKKYMLDEQLRKTVLLLEDKWTKKELDFDIELDKQPFYGNEKMLDRVWFNLIDNAIKHSPQGGMIRISVSESGGLVTVTVADSGEGMTEETQKHIFEKFYQGDSSHKAEGNGLGLALVKRIVDLCEGTITVKSELGKGSEFSVTLPNEQ